MKTLYPALVFIFISVIAFNCQKEARTIGNGTEVPRNGTNTNTPSPVTTTLQGNVTDENGKPAVDVAIKVGNGTATTDSKGCYNSILNSL